MLHNVTDSTMSHAKSIPTTITLHKVVLRLLSLNP